MYSYKDDKLNMTMLLATGSSDSYAYIYSLKLNQEVRFYIIY